MPTRDLTLLYDIGIKKCYTTKNLLYNMLCKLQIVIYNIPTTGSCSRGVYITWCIAFFMLCNLRYNQNLLYNLLYSIYYNGMDIFYTASYITEKHYTNISCKKLDYVIHWQNMPYKTCYIGIKP